MRRILQNYMVQSPNDVLTCVLCSTVEILTDILLTAHVVYRDDKHTSTDVYNLDASKPSTTLRLK
jgi:hypothetical protein